MATHPKGRLVFMNYKETDTAINNDERLESSQLMSFLTDKHEDRIEVIISGEQFQNNICEIYRKALIGCGYTNFDFLHVTNVSIYNHELRERLAAANVVLFAGDQSRMYSIFKGTPLLRLLHKRYMHEDNFTVAGVSAGGLCIPGRMISNFPEDSSIRRTMDLVPGLGFLHNCIIDTCYSQRTRYEKLAHTVLENHDLIGVGLGPDTALIIHDGYLGSCRGDGTIVIINSLDTHYLKGCMRNFDHTFLMRNLKGKVLIDGCSVNLRDGQ
jgi:cyanophycinase